MRLPVMAVALGLIGSSYSPPWRPAADGQKPATDNAALPAKAVSLERLTWPEAERLLTPEAVVVLPLGAAAKEHGPHLQLRNDLTLAEYLTRRLSPAAVVVAPPLTYHFYPAFLEYPGSTSLTLATARDMTVEIARSLARYGPRRFYVLNTGISTLRPLADAAKVLAQEGILLHFTNLEAQTAHVVRGLQEQPGGSHADEIETSMMLYIDPAVVDMTRAVSDYTPALAGPLRLTRQPRGPATYSRSGAWGDPTLATREKGRVIVEALVAGVLADIETLRKSTVPPGSPLPAGSHAVPAAAVPQPRTFRQSGCTEGDERTITGMGTAFTVAWTNQDAQLLAALWSDEGDIVHPDQSVERSSQVIRQNRAYLFTLPEYKASRHSLGVGHIRCLAADIAVADGKWDLRGVVDASRRPLPPLEGLATLVLKRTGGGWRIEAYRYTITSRTAPPTFLKQPGFADR